MNKPIDLRVGLTDISFHSENTAPPSLPEKKAMPFLGEAISSHLDALWKLERGPELVAKVCVVPDEELTLITQPIMHDFATETSQWLRHLPQDIDAKILTNAQQVLDEMVVLNTELDINRKLLVPA